MRVETGARGSLIDQFDDEFANESFLCRLWES